MIEVFKSIKTRILSEVPEIRNVELWNNQVEKAEGASNQINIYPAVFLGIDGSISFATRQEVGVEQEGVFVLSVHIVQQDLIGNANDDRHTDWSILELKQKVYKALQGFLPDECTNALVRVSEEMSDNHSQLYDYVQDYSCKWVDSDLVDEGILVQVELDVTPTLVMEDYPTHRTARSFEAPTEYDSDLEADLEAVL